MTRPRRARDDDGVALVEFALVLPILMVLLLGMVSGAMAWNQSQALGQGARVASRQAATLPLPEPLTEADMEVWLDDVVDRALAASEGEMGASAPERSVCVSYVDPMGDLPDRTTSRRMDAAGNRSTAATPCFDDGQAATVTRVQVLLGRRTSINTGLYRHTITLSRQAVYRFEASSGI